MNIRPGVCCSWVFSGLHAPAHFVSHTNTHVLPPLLSLCVSDHGAAVMQPPELTPIQTFHDEGFVPPPTPEAAFSHK